MTIVDQILLPVLVLFCVIAALKDVKTRKIPNWISLTLFLIWLVSIFAKWILVGIHILDIHNIDILWTCAMQVLTSAVVCCLLALCVVLANKWRKRKGQVKTSPFGMGDVKLLMVVCLFLGPTLSFICLFASCVAFIVYMLFLNIIFKTKITKAPFAPFILAGVCVASVIAII